MDWLPVPHVVAPSPTKELSSRSRLHEAIDFLYVTLGNGPVRSKDILKAAKENDIAEKTLRRAKSHEGIDDWKKNLDGQGVATYWELRRKKEDFFYDFVMVLKQLLDESLVIGTSEAPRVIVHKEQLVVVKSHLGGGANLQIDFEPSDSGQSVEIVATDGDATVYLDASDRAFFDKFHDEMKQLGLTWDSQQYAERTGGSVEDAA